MATAALAHANAAASGSASGVNRTVATAAKSRGTKRKASTVAGSLEPPASAPACIKADPEERTTLSSNENSHGNVRVKQENAACALVKTEELLKESGNALQWHRLCSTQELSCKLTLASGQVFSWQYHAHACEWSGVVGDKVFALRENDQFVEYRCLHQMHFPPQEAHAILTHYFRLETEAAPLYQAWTTLDDPMAQLIRSLPGHRMIRQDPVECLFSFICSSNNNIQRIQQMVDKLRATYGNHLCTVDAASLVPISRDSKLSSSKEREATTISYYSFPSPETLATKCEEATLRALGFGYRAPFITKSSQQLVALGGVEYLHQIRDWKPQEGVDFNTVDEMDEYQAKLMVFTGVGRKVADCIALFALERLDAIPVDTHVWQIACREFDPSLVGKKSITPSVYKSVGDHFRRRFSPCAGWAHSVLFTGDLTAFQSHLPSDMQKKKKKAVKKKQVKKKVVDVAGRIKAPGNKAK